MTEQHDAHPESTSGWRARAGAITRALAAIATGIVWGYSTRDVGEGLTAAGIALSLLREASGRPPK